MNGRLWKYWVFGGGGLAFLLCVGIVFWTHWAETSPAPGLSAVLSSNNLLSLTITNGVTNEYYEIYYQVELSATGVWSFKTNGSLGQTQFLVSTIPLLKSFYKARATNDWDGDGIENWRDADPNSTNVGVLTITIESPANGSTLQ